MKEVPAYTGNKQIIRNRNRKRDRDLSMYSRPGFVVRIKPVYQY